jgi:hypothetical protein
MGVKMRIILAISLLLLTGCQSLPEGQSAYGTTAFTRWNHPEAYAAMVAENDESKKNAFASRYVEGTTGQTMQPANR